MQVLLILLISSSFFTANTGSLEHNNSTVQRSNPALNEQKVAHKIKRRTEIKVPPRKSFKSDFNSSNEHKQTLAQPEKKVEPLSSLKKIIFPVISRSKPASSQEAIKYLPPRSGSRPTTDHWCPKFGPVKPINVPARTKHILPPKAPPSSPPVHK
ncbi:MAG: hypothetical protein EBS13_04825 [Verrucomicrobia bacterium]|nr:hypothetical protein [Verrucomicrobiota bacterium]